LILENHPEVITFGWFVFADHYILFTDQQFCELPVGDCSKDGKEWLN